jgi:hypothetical protein
MCIYTHTHIYTNTGCVFTNYNPADPASFKGVCGAHAKFRIQADYVAWSVLAVSGQSILVVSEIIS